MLGFMTMAFDASKPDDAGPIGVFEMPSDGQLLNCPGGTNVKRHFYVKN